MNELKEGIYVCSICKVFICKEDEIIENHIPHQELDTLNYIALNKFDNLSHNLEFTKKATVSSEIPLFSYCGLLDVNCKRCKQKIGFIPVSTTASTTQLRDKAIMMKDRLIFNEVQVKEERMDNNDFEDVSNRTLIRSENKNFQKRKSLFLMKIEENIDSLQEAMNKCKTKYSFLFEFYEDLVQRLEFVEENTQRLQQVMFSLTTEAFNQKLKPKKKTSVTHIERSGSNEKNLIMYKPPKKSTSTSATDAQKWLFLQKTGNVSKNKRKRENSDEKLRNEEFGGKPYLKALKYD